MVFRCMLVGLDEASVGICKVAMRPLQAIVVSGIHEACQRMSEVLPLIVILADDAVKSPELIELTGACGAEVLSVTCPPNAVALPPRILEALRKGEARRAGK